MFYWFDAQKLKVCVSLAVVWNLASCGYKPKKEREPQPPVATAPEVPRRDLPPAPEFLKLPIANDETLRRSVGLTPWLNAGHHGERITIAILDNGYDGLSDVSGKFLPPGLAVAAAPVKNEAQTPHGTVLAEIISALTSGSPLWNASSRTPIIKLYNANGYTNFAAAVDQAITDRADIILYSQVWEFGGNFDGRGFINAVVNKALRSGVLWINAAGNYQESSWQGRLLINPDQSAALPYQGRYIRMNVRQDQTPVKITLSWNDFTDSKDWRTSRDLDLRLLTESGVILDVAQKIQDGRDHGGDARYSAHAREIIMTSLSAGTYLLAVDVKSSNFDGFSRIRIAADGADVTLMDKSADASVMIPADNPFVLTIGANDTRQSSAGTTIAGTTKPDALAPSLIEFGSDSQSRFRIDGSSTAAAVAAAVFAVYEGHCGKVNYDKALRLVRSGALLNPNTADRSLLLPAVPDCFEP